MKKQPYSPQLHDFYADKLVQLRNLLDDAGDLVALLAVSREALRLGKACPYKDLRPRFFDLCNQVQDKIDQKYSFLT